MTHLSHSAAHERLADLSLEPGALRRLADDLAAPAGAAESPLSAHVRTCMTCRAEIGDWLGVHDRVAAALAGPGSPVRLEELASAEPIRAPQELRSAVARIATPRTVDADRAPVNASAGLVAVGTSATLPGRAVVAVPVGSVSLDHRRPTADRWGRRLLPLVAVLAVLVAASGLLVDQSRRLDQARQETAALAGVTAALDRVMLDPAHRAVALTAADGSAGGSVAWSSHDLVVLTTSLAVPPAGSVYRCWVERDGRRSPIGMMYFADGTGYWTGSLDAWATTSFGAGSTFGISLEPRSGSIGTPATLVANLGS